MRFVITLLLILWFPTVTIAPTTATLDTPVERIVEEIPEPEVKMVLSMREPNGEMRWLDPLFRLRLERVIDRMVTEYGHSVKVVEGRRSLERQEYLYSRGRTKPGRVVTWTLDSHHIEGRAADLIIDRSYTNMEAYRRLHKIAKEEGLGHLSMRDPGHLELPDSVPSEGVSLASK